MGVYEHHTGHLLARVAVLAGLLLISTGVPAPARATVVRAAAINLHALAVNTDGSVWFAWNKAIGRFDPASGRTSYVAVPVADTELTALAGGRGGAMWYMDDQGNIGRIGVHDCGASYAAQANGLSLLLGPDGAMWYTALDSLGRLSSDGHVDELSTPQQSGVDKGMVVGPDNAMWLVREDAAATLNQVV